MSGELTVILANGDYPSAQEPLEYLENAVRIVCCDGAAEKLILNGRIPDWIVGDLDSLSPELQQRFPDRIYQEKEQETNDLCKAFRFCLAHGWKRIRILGATGKREDHTLGNIAHLVDFIDGNQDTEMVTDRGVFSVYSSSAEISSKRGGQISLFTPDPSTRVTTENLKYPLNDSPLKNWWNGTLNEALGDSFRLIFESGKKLIVFRAFQHGQKNCDCFF